MKGVGPILFWVRPDFHSHPGGDSLQALQMRDCLEQLGVPVTISMDPDLDLARFEAVFLWHLERLHDTYLYFLLARRSGRKIVLVDTYWPWDGRPLPQRSGFTRRSLAENLKLWLRLALHSRDAVRRRYIGAALKAGWRRGRDAMLHSADMHIGNSGSEIALLSREAGRELNAVVVHNIADLGGEAADPLEPAARELLVCCGHFCPRKNQLALIRAVAGTEHQVVFIGGVRPARQAYYRRCRKAGGIQCRFTGALSHAETLDYLRRAKVHICASRLETPGLANLEAAAAGCSLVLPRVAPIMDYFPEGRGPVFYYDDLSGGEFLEALRQARNAPSDPAWADEMRQRYSRAAMTGELKKVLDRLF